MPEAGTAAADAACDERAPLAEEALRRERFRFNERLDLLRTRTSALHAELNRVRQQLQGTIEELERLRIAVEQLPTAVLIAEAQSGRLMLGNRQAAALFGHPHPLPFLESKWASACAAFKGFHGDGRPFECNEWPLARSLHDGAVIVDEVIGFVRPDGTRGTMSASSTPIRDGSGNILGAVATFWDVTDRTEAEVRLRESEQRFRLVVEGARDYAIVMLDPDGRIVTWNSGAERIFGYTAAEAIGRDHAILYTPEDRALGDPQRRLRQALGSTAGFPEDRWLRRKDGSTFWSSGVLAALRPQDDLHRGYLKVLRDATAMKSAELGLQQAKSDAETMRDSAEAANRAKDEFVATVSHELRTPLTAILLWARILRETNFDRAALEEGISTIERAARAQQQLVEDLLDVSRISSGKLRLALRATALGEAIDAALEAVRPAAEAREVQLVAQISPDIGVVRADPDRIQQVVWNLLTNGVKFTPAGGNVTLTAWREGHEVLVRVADTGIGIRPTFLPFVFDRFRQDQAGSAREHSGLGLGLAIARQLTELHGGTLTGESAGEGKGAAFLARMPLPRMADENEAVRQPPPRIESR